MYLLLDFGVYPFIYILISGELRDLKHPTGEMTLTHRQNKAKSAANTSPLCCLPSSALSSPKMSVFVRLVQPKQHEYSCIHRLITNWSQNDDMEFIQRSVVL